MEDFDKDTKKEVQIDITKLRESGRPLWMSPLGIDHPADMLGGGGDIWSDRLTPEWPRYYGQELMSDEAQGVQQSTETKSFSGHEGFPPKSENTKLNEDAFFYVNPKENDGDQQEMSAQEKSDSSEEEGKSSGGLGVGVNVGLNLKLD